MRWIIPGAPGLPGLGGQKGKDLLWAKEEKTHVCSLQVISASTDYLVKRESQA